jgi:hypothetical protein
MNKVSGIARGGHSALTLSTDPWCVTAVEHLERSQGLPWPVPRRRPDHPLVCSSTPWGSAVRHGELPLGREDLLASGFQGPFLLRYLRDRPRAAEVRPEAA